MCPIKKLSVFDKWKIQTIEKWLSRISAASIKKKSVFFFFFKHHKESIKVMTSRTPKTGFTLGIACLGHLQLLEQLWNTITNIKLNCYEAENITTLEKWTSPTPVFRRGWVYRLKFCNLIWLKSPLIGGGWGLRWSSQDHVRPHILYIIYKEEEGIGKITLCFDIS